MNKISETGEKYLHFNFSLHLSGLQPTMLTTMYPTWSKKKRSNETSVAFSFYDCVLFFFCNLLKFVVSFCNSKWIWLREQNVRIKHHMDGLFHWKPTKPETLIWFVHCLVTLSFSLNWKGNECIGYGRFIQQPHGLKSTVNNFFSSSAQFLHLWSWAYKRINAIFNHFHGFHSLCFCLLCKFFSLNTIFQRRLLRRHFIKINLYSAK